jgi:SufS family cysteine desulfurase
VFDFAAFKKQFPLFDQPENQQLVYLDNAATSQRPACVIDAVTDFYRHSNANTHRSSHRLARQATAMVERVRKKSAQFINAGSPKEVVFCRGATEALNLLAFSLCEEMAEGDEIILSRAEHHANIVPWQMAAERKNLSLVFLPDRNGQPDLSRLPELLSERTRVVTLTAGSNAMGFTLDIPLVAELLGSRDITFVVDAAQYAAHQSVDVQAMGCDFLVCSAHKFYGPTGIGLLYGRRQLLASLPPWQGGGEMIEKVELDHSRYADAPHRFETGTSSLAAIAGLEACLDFWQSLDREAMRIYEQQLLRYLHQQLAGLDSIKLLSSEQNNLGVAAFVPADDNEWSAVDLAHLLDEVDIALRVGHHCAMPLVDSLGVGPTLRASIAAYNSLDDIDRLITTIERVSDLSLSVNREATSDESLLLDDFSSCSLQALQACNNWQLRYRQLMQWANLVSSKPAIRKDDQLVPGCESATWLVHWQRGDKQYFAVDSDSRVVKGLAVLLLTMVQGCHADEIQQLPLNDIFTSLQMDKHLSPSRSNGFYALWQHILDSVSG